MGHRRDVHRGDLWTCSASGVGGGQERACGGAGVWARARDRTQDAAVFGAAGLPAATAGEAAEAGAVDGRDRRDSGRRQEQPQEAAAHGEADLRPVAGRSTASRAATRS